MRRIDRTRDDLSNDSIERFKSALKSSETSKLNVKDGFFVYTNQENVMYLIVEKELDDAESFTYKADEYVPFSLPTNGESEFLPKMSEPSDNQYVFQVHNGG